MKAYFVLSTLAVALVAACSSTDPVTPSADAAADGAADGSSPSDGASDGQVADAAGDSPADAPQPTDSGYVCGPGVQPTACGNCGGQSNSTTCNQTCDAKSCGDGKAYDAQCDLTKGTCDCFINQVKVCSCTITKPSNPNGCEPETYGGVMCCWNVG